MTGETTDTSTAGATTNNVVTSHIDPRESALYHATRFHRDAGTDDPQTVVDTAKTFLAFLQGGDS